jgi:hypothetical protein
MGGFEVKAMPQIFLSYAREDKEKVENLYQELTNAGFKPWMDTKDLLPGEKWESIIQQAIRNSDFFLLCLSKNSVKKRGYFQREKKTALDILQEMLDDDIYLIPIRLEECEVPSDLRNYQWVDLFAEDGRTQLMKAIQVGMERREISLTPVGSPEESSRGLTTVVTKESTESAEMEHTLVNLYELLTRFDEEGLRDICFRLNVDYDNLRGERKTAKARELVQYLARRNKLKRLAEVILVQRSDISIENLPVDSELRDSLESLHTPRNNGPDRSDRPFILIFGLLFVAFLIYVFIFGPETLPEYKQRVLAFICALLAGLFAFFLTGVMKLDLKVIRSRFGELGVKTTGGLAAFVLVLIWWLTPLAPVATEKMYKVQVRVVDLQQKPVEDAQLLLSIGGQPKKVADGWQFDIPESSKPPNGKITISAATNNPPLSGEQDLYLGAERNPVIVVHLSPSPYFGLWSDFFTHTSDNRPDPTKWDAPSGWFLDSGSSSTGNDRELVVRGTEIGFNKLPAGYAFYNFDFCFKITVLDSRGSVTWVLRARNKRDYYLFRMTFPQRREGAKIEGYAYEDGKQPRSLSGPDVPIYYAPFDKEDLLFITIHVEDEKFKHFFKLQRRNRSNIDGLHLRPVPWLFTDDPNRFYRFGTIGFRGDDQGGIVKVDDVRIQPHANQPALHTNSNDRLGCIPPQP